MNSKYYNKYIKYKNKYTNAINELTIIDKPPEFIIQNTFPTIKDVDRRKIKFIEDGLYTSHGIKGAEFIANIIEDHIGTNITLTINMAKIGIDVINMAYQFQKIIAVEENKIMNGLLKYNVNLYKLDLRVKIYRKLLDDFEQDAIYLDNKKDIIDLAEFYFKHKNKVRMFVFKVSKEYDFNRFFNKTNLFQYEIYTYSGNLKFYVISIMTKN